jgi:hypothetical protein
MLGIEFFRFVVMLLLANAFLRLSLTIALRYLPTNTTDALAFAI